MCCPLLDLDACLLHQQQQGEVVSVTGFCVEYQLAAMGLEMLRGDGGCHLRNAPAGAGVRHAGIRIAAEVCCTRVDGNASNASKIITSQACHTQKLLPLQMDSLQR